MWRFSIRHISSFTQNWFSSGCKLDQEKRDRRSQEFFQNVTGSLRDLKARRFRQQLRAPISTPWEARGLNRCKVCERWPGGSGSLEICEVKFFFGGGFQLKMHECLESHRLVVGVEHLVASFPISSRLVNDWTQVPCTSSVLLLLPAGCPVLWGWCAAVFDSFHFVSWHAGYHCTRVSPAAEPVLSIIMLATPAALQKRWSRSFL